LPIQIFMLPSISQIRQANWRPFVFLSAGAMIIGAMGRFGIIADIDSLSYSLQIQRLLNGIGALAWFLAWALIVVGGVAWGAGSIAGNLRMSSVGRRLTLAALTAAVSTGYAAILTNVAFSIGLPNGG
jgi:hypothetical protein